MFRPKRLWNLTRVVGEDKTLTNKERRRIIGRDGAHVDFMSNGSDLLSVYEYRKAVYVVIAGSNDLGDWIKNVLWFIATVTGAALGFQGSAKKLSQDLFLFHREALQKKKLYIVGHSRGGAIAIVMGYLLSSCNPQVVTFGTPKPGSKRFRKKCEQVGLKVTNYQIIDDFICRLPWLRGCHVGDVVVLPTVSDNRIENHKGYGKCFD
jgi:hypothetical protein